MDTLNTLTYHTTGRIARITLNRPARGNGITLDLPRELAACVERANLDPAIHVIALSGNGSDMGDANTHDNTNLPILLAGGGFKHGQHLAFKR